MAALAVFNTPSEKNASKGAIHSHIEIIVATAPALLIAFREGRSPTRDELAAKCNLRDDYSAEGLSKNLGDSLGFGKNGAKLHRVKGKPVYIRCAENVKLLVDAIPEENRESIAMAAGFADQLEMVLFGPTLPSVVQN